MASTPAQPSADQPGENPGASPSRGFASMDPQRQRQIASEGGRAAHERGTAHEFSSEEARRAGSKGGQAAHEKRTAHEFDSAEARAAGRKGGQAAHQKGTAHEFDSEQARAAGRKGGQSTRKRAAQARADEAVHSGSAGEESGAAP